MLGLFIRYKEDMHQAPTWRRIDMFDQMQLHTGNFQWKVQNETGGHNMPEVCSMEKIEMSGLSI
jgi:hypothetical protein